MDFTAFYERHAGWMYRLACAILKNSQDAEDALQDAFITVFRRADFYGSLEEDRLKAALTVIVKSRSINILRKRREESTDPELMERMLPGDEISLTAGLMLEEAIAALPPRQREILLLHFADGFSESEIAEMLDCGRENVRKTLYRARKQIRRYLESEE
ncbi:MAG: RNA polymerase sigma factor [Lachnospiraceae bacterium]|nr:RNA polymerase sigma factor [Lachnospiraceae bacterium]